MSISPPRYKAFSNNNNQGFLPLRHPEQIPDPPCLGRLHMDRADGSIDAEMQKGLHSVGQRKTDGEWFWERKRERERQREGNMKRKP